MTHEEIMANTNEYWKLLEPPTKQGKANKGRWTDVICSRCKKSRHSKEHCHWNLNNIGILKTKRK
jgi:hypothetical protein